MDCDTVSHPLLERDTQCAAWDQGVLRRLPNWGAMAQDSFYGNSQARRHWYCSESHTPGRFDESYLINHCYFLFFDNSIKCWIIRLLCNSILYASSLSVSSFYPFKYFINLSNVRSPKYALAVHETPTRPNLVCKFYLLFLSTETMHPLNVSLPSHQTQLHDSMDSWHHNTLNHQK